MPHLRLVRNIETRSALQGSHKMPLTSANQDILLKKLLDRDIALMRPLIVYSCAIFYKMNLLATHIRQNGGIDKTNRASVHKLFSDFAQLKKMLDNIRERFDETSKKCAFESIWRSEILHSLSRPYNKFLQYALGNNNLHSFLGTHLTQAQVSVSHDFADYEESSISEDRSKIIWGAIFGETREYGVLIPNDFINLARDQLSHSSTDLTKMCYTYKNVKKDLPKGILIKIFLQF